MKCSRINFRKTLTSFVVFVCHILAFNACISIAAGKIWTTLTIMTLVQWVQSDNFTRAQFNFTKFAYLQWDKLSVAKSARNLVIAMQTLNLYSFL